MRVSDFHFHLPPELIAKHPPAERDAARMLTFDRATGQTADRYFRDLPDLLNPGDLVIFNDSRVIPARLFGRRAGLRTQTNSPGPSGTIEVLLTEQLSSTDWRTLVKPARKVQPGETLLFSAKAMQPETTLTADVMAAGDRGERTLRFQDTPDFFARLDALGHIPLPPYLHRADTAEDRARYQTVYADPAQPGSAAAPTAGLHFTPAILHRLDERGVETATVTLHVGLGTFQPVHVEDIADIHLHAEHYTLPAATADAINRARREGRRIVAVGTTTVRTLEHCAREAVARASAADWQLHPHSGSTSIFLRPGDTFQLVNALLTNFHLPESTLLMLVSAFAAQRSDPQQGIAHVLAAYRHAVQQQYRFFSYGDCMFLQ
ncbi:tRNA preQ1(34) S-adenosylmethionine ribosyltransferase-isomerase QueA [Terriglobus aquaticus]|uniref:S-adenosylmethionine:tRNA ribosyltransferase-isomerase n=1 Tax=Terriglobus aquaticus TaxID=940139 RepID=A0ABW9KKC7_9BACT|nr:tRNA preQ1(34) S-adenosylmethionine ribosyltransferase-isomerase QueA [Terriglobus aquaticus]